MHNLEYQIAKVLQEVKILKSRMGVWVIKIVKYFFESLVECSSRRKSKISDCSFGFIVDMKSLLELFPIGLTYTLSKMLK